MFKTKKNLGRNIKHKEHKNTKKTSQYEENYNEVILNDLVDENKVNNEDNVQEEPSRKTKKKKAINLNLGTKKKSTSDDQKNKKRKNSNKKHNSNDDEPKEIIGTESKNDTIEVETQPKDNKSTKPAKTKKTEKRSKKTSKKKSKNQPSEESTKKSNKKTPKKQSKPIKEDKTKKISKKPRKEDEVKTKSVEEIEVEEINDEEETMEGSVFRNFEGNEEVDDSNQYEVEEENLSEHKFDDIIWSDDKFPKN